jgi:hypothetical protein
MAKAPSLVSTTCHVTSTIAALTPISGIVIRGGKGVFKTVAASVSVAVTVVVGEAITGVQVNEGVGDTGVGGWVIVPVATVSVATGDETGVSRVSSGVVVAVAVKEGVSIAWVRVCVGVVSSAATIRGTIKVGLGVADELGVVPRVKEESRG